MWARVPSAFSRPCARERGEGRQRGRGRGRGPPRPRHVGQDVVPARRQVLLRQHELVVSHLSSLPPRRRRGTCPFSAPAVRPKTRTPSPIGAKGVRGATLLVLPRKDISLRHGPCRRDDALGSAIGAPPAPPTRPS